MEAVKPNKKIEIETISDTEEEDSPLVTPKAIETHIIPKILKKEPSKEVPKILKKELPKEVPKELPKVLKRKVRIEEPHSRHLTGNLQHEQSKEQPKEEVKEEPLPHEEINEEKKETTIVEINLESDNEDEISEKVPKEVLKKTQKEDIIEIELDKIKKQELFDILQLPHMPILQQFPIPMMQFPISQLGLQHLQLPIVELGQVVQHEELTKQFNVGGANFNLTDDIIEGFKIDIHKLFKIKDELNKDVYFLDRDPNYFTQIVEIAQKYDSFNSFEKELDSLSDNLIAELCRYKLIDAKFKPEAIIKVKKTVEFEDLRITPYDTLVIIEIGEEVFETYSKTLARSKHFERQLKMRYQSQAAGRSIKVFNFKLMGIKANEFRYVLNFLRHSELFVSTKGITDLLKKYEIDYVSTDESKIHKQMVSVDEPIDQKYLVEQMQQFNIDSIETYNIISTEKKTKLEFGTDLIFNLKPEHLGHADCITDLLLVIDLPILNPIDKMNYVDNIQYKIIENINIIDVQKDNTTLLLYANSKSLSLWPIIYTNKQKEFQNLGNPMEKKKLIYDNSLIDLHRIYINLNLLGEKQYLPVYAMNPKAIVKIAPLSNIIFSNKKVDKEINLLNVYMIAKVKSNLIPKQSITCHFHKLHTITVQIRQYSDNFRNIASMTLGKLGIIKEFYFTISENPKTKHEQISYTDALIDVSIMKQVTNATHKTEYLLVTRIDSFILNSYGPLMKNGCELPKGVYYHSFASSGSQSGLPGADNLLIIKTKKIDGFINLFIVENFSYNI